MKMNKYQESLDLIKAELLHVYLLNEDKWNEVNEMMKPYFSNMQELVDKETPLKPKWVQDEGYLHRGYRVCRKCDAVAMSSNNWWLPNYCSRCANKLDWGDVNETNI